MARGPKKPGASSPGPGEACLPRAGEGRVGPFVMVIFGGTGDLTARKLIPALFALQEDRSLAGSSSVLAVGRRPHTDESYRRHVLSAVRENLREGTRPERAAAFARRFHYLRGDLGDDGLYTELRTRLESLSPSGRATDVNIIFYMAVPPRLVPIIVAGLDKVGLCRSLPQAKLIVEKPFGRDLRSAEA
ncbi:MAG: hypothetical protein ACXWHI_12070, partial [Candidatus Aminicenantales bacterium]